MKTEVANVVNTKSRYLPKHAWYMADAQIFVRKLQAVAWPLGYHIALGGGVLNHGYSDKDLDLYVLPIYNQPGIVDELSLLTRLGADVFDGAKMSEVCSLQDSPHECFAYSVRFQSEAGKSVELFIVRRS